MSDGAAAAAAVETVAEDAAQQAAAETAAAVAIHVQAADANAAATQTTAEAAVALANAQAAATELDAAERQRALIEGLEAWRAEVTEALSQIAAQIAGLLELRQQTAAEISAMQSEISSVRDQLLLILPPSQPGQPPAVVAVEPVAAAVGQEEARIPAPKPRRRLV